VQTFEVTLPEPPNGMYPARVDEKGRLKLPVAFQHYFAVLPEKKLFVTSLDRRIGHIYPLMVWRENKKLFDSFRENPRAARRVAFNANDLGAESEMDQQGRILLPPELRRELGIEDRSVRICAYKGRIEIYSEAIYEERKKEAAESPVEDLELLEGAGLL
jgi:MraZ protein